MACEDGIMTPETIDELLEMKEKLLYLNKHQNKIWQGKDNKWRTYVGVGHNRKLIKKSTRDDVINAVITYYKETEYNPSVHDIFEEWVQYKLEGNEITVRTKDRYYDDYNRFIKGTVFERTFVKTITEDDLELYIRHVLSQNISAKCFSNLRTIILGIFKYAKRKHLTEISITYFFKDLDISKKSFKPKKLKLEEAVFNEDEIPKLMMYLYSHPCVENYGIIFAFQSGVRCGELAALKFTDISDNILHVQRQEVVYNSSKGKQMHAIVEYTKTEAGDRYIYLPENSNNVLFALRWNNRDGDYIFMKDGRRVYKTSFNNYLKKACLAVGIPVRTMHKIRRTYGTTLIDNNVEDSLIMSQMGHSDISTTRKYYYYANKNNEHNKEQINKSIQW